MILGIILFTSPFLMLFAVYKYARLRKRIELLEKNSVPKIEYEKLESDLILKVEEYNSLKNEFSLNKSMVNISVDKDLIKTIVNPEDMNYKQLESCMNYFIENYHNESK